MHICFLHRVGAALWARIEMRRARTATTRQKGYSTETVLVTVALAALALAVVAILVPKILAKAASIQLGG